MNIYWMNKGSKPVCHILCQLSFVRMSSELLLIYLTAFRTLPLRCLQGPLWNVISCQHSASLLWASPCLVLSPLCHKSQAPLSSLLSPQWGLMILHLKGLSPLSWICSPLSSSAFVVLVHVLSSLAGSRQQPSGYSPHTLPFLALVYFHGSMKACAKV